MSDLEYRVWEHAGCFAVEYRAKGSQAEWRHLDERCGMYGTLEDAMDRAREHAAQRAKYAAAPKYHEVKL